jgi:RNA polymerase sigma factor (sigma-70 family)
MTQTTMGTVLGHLRRLAAAGADDLSDAHLLDRFRTHHEEAAFTALLGRHGPMVLGVCRHLLRHEQDAEDAFQATFLVLAKKAAAIREGPSLASWLHGVAYRVARRARRDAARRGAHERAAAAAACGRGEPELSWRELQALLDEEVCRLPEKYRAPFVLCGLEGLSLAAAARRLGWKLGTVSGRLTQARRRLQARLRRRGVSLSVLLCVAGLARAAASAAVRAPLAAATAAAALRAVAGRGPGAASAAVALAERTACGAGARGWALGVLVLAGGLFLGGAGVLTRQPVGGVSKEGPAAQTTAEGPRRAADERRPVAGVVRDAAGKPVPGAHVAVVALREEPYRGRIGERRHETLATGRADREGRFHLEVRRTAPAPAGPFVQLLAAAPGHGLAWAAVRPAAGPRELAVVLRREREARGRLIDLQGQPVQGARLHVFRVATSGAGGFAPPGYGFHDLPKGLGAWPASLTTDAEGRFAVRGLGEGMAVTVLVTDERFAPQEIRVAAVPGKGETSHVLLPPQVLEGEVVGEDSGKPVGKVLLDVSAVLEVPAHEGRQRWEHAQGWSDEHGRFRLRCPPGRLLVHAYPAEGSPYLARLQSVEWPRGRVKHTVRLTLPRGVRVRGRVVEELSGKPVAGAVVEYRPYATNPFAHYTVASWRVIGTEFITAKADGTFAATVLPGEGHLLARGATRDFVPRKLDTAVLHSGGKGGRPMYVPAFARVDLKPAAEVPEVKLRVRRGVTLRGRVLDPDGKPVKEASLVCPFHLRLGWAEALAHDYSPEPVRVKDGKFELPGCEPGAEFPVYVLEAAGRLGALVRLTAKAEGEEVTVRLSPCGSVRARFVDGKGNPRRGYGLSVELQLDGRPPVQLSQRELLGAARRLTSDERGWVTVPGLIPGATYHCYGARDGVTFTAEAGKTKALPDQIVPAAPR